MMLQASAAALFLGWLALQEPPKPQDPPRQEPRAGEQKTSSTTLDAELKAAVDAFNRANSYRFRADGRAMPMHGTTTTAPVARTEPGQPATPPVPPTTPPDEPRDDRVARAKERSDAPQDFRLDGTFERGKPIALMSDSIEAFRQGDKLVYRQKGQTEWSLFTGTPTSGAPATPPPATPPTPPPPGGERTQARGETSTLHLLAHIPAPSELLTNLETRIVSCTRAPSTDPKAGTTTFECQVRPDPSHKLGGAAGAGSRDATRPGGAVASAADTCMLRVTVNQGKIERIVLEKSHALSGKGEPAAREPASPPATPPTRPSSDTSPGPDDVVYRYNVSDIGTAEVKVPDEAARLLGTGR